MKKIILICAAAALFGCSKGSNTGSTMNEPSGASRTNAGYQSGSQSSTSSAPSSTSGTNQSSSGSSSGGNP